MEKLYRYKSCKEGFFAGSRALSKELKEEVNENRKSLAKVKRLY